MAQATPDNVEYVTKAELATLLRISTRTITNYVTAGTLPKPAKIGRKALWAKDTLLQFLGNQPGNQ